MDSRYNTYVVNNSNGKRRNSLLDDEESENEDLRMTTPKRSKRSSLLISSPSPKRSSESNLNLVPYSNATTTSSSSAITTTGTSSSQSSSNAMTTYRQSGDLAMTISIQEKISMGLIRDMTPRKQLELLEKMNQAQMKVLKEGLGYEEKTETQFSFNQEHDLYFAHFFYWKKEDIERNYHWICNLIQENKDTSTSNREDQSKFLSGMESDSNWNLNQLKLLDMTIRHSLRPVKPKDFVVTNTKQYHEHTNGRSTNNPAARRGKRGSERAEPIFWSKSISEWEIFLGCNFTDEEKKQIKIRYKNHGVFLVDQYPHKEMIISPAHSLIENLHLYYYYNHSNYYYYCYKSNLTTDIDSHFRSDYVTSFDKYYLTKLQDVIKSKMIDDTFCRKDELHELIDNNNIFLNRDYTEMELIDDDDFNQRMIVSSRFNKSVKQCCFEASKISINENIKEDTVQQQEQLIENVISAGPFCDDNWDSIIDNLLHNQTFDINYIHLKKAQLKTKRLMHKFLREMLWVIGIVRKSLESNGLHTIYDNQKEISVNFNSIQGLSQGVSFKIQKSPRDQEVEIFQNLIILLNKQKYKSLDNQVVSLQEAYRGRFNKNMPLQLRIKGLISLIGCTSQDKRSSNKKNKPSVVEKEK